MEVPGLFEELEEGESDGGIVGGHVTIIEMDKKELGFCLPLLFLFWDI